MIGADVARIGHAFEQSGTAVAHRPALAMARHVENRKRAAKGLDDPLQAETHPELGNPGLRDGADEIGNGELRRLARPR